MMIHFLFMISTTEIDESVTGRIFPLGLLKADTMMCRSISGKSILVLMQFSPNYRITLTAHIAVE
jgi:hypothetical protein